MEEERVGDLAAAAATWTAIVDADPSNERARRALVRVSEARQDWHGVVEALRRDLQNRRTSPDEAEDAKAREDLLLRIGHLQETRLNDPEATFASYRDVAQANPYSAPAIAGLERLAAAGHAAKGEIARLSLPLYERTDNAAKLAEANEVLLAGADTLGERVERLEKLTALYGGPLNDPAKAYRASLALFEIDPADVANRDALVGFATAAKLTGELGEKLRAAAAASEERNLRRDLLVVVAELEEKQLGRAPEAEKVYAQILAAEPLHAGAFRALARLFREGKRWAELRALLDTRQLAALDGTRTARSAGRDRRAGRVVALRSRSRALRLREDAGARSGGSARPPRAGAPLRRPRALARSRAAARDPGRLRLRERDARAGVPPRRPAGRPAGRRRRRARFVGGDRPQGAEPRRGAPAAGEAAGDPAAAPAGRADPGAGLRGGQRLGASGGDPGGPARGPAGPRGGGVAGAGGRHSREPAAGAGGGARHLAAGAGGRRRPTPTRSPRSSGWAPRWSGSPTWSTSIKSWRSGATART